MTDYCYYRLKDIQEFDNIKDIFRKNFIFRGQSNNEWKFKTSQEREIEKNPIGLRDLSSKYKKKSFESTVIEKINTVRQNDNSRFLPLNKFLNSLDSISDEPKKKTLKIMYFQHYGCPTRFLDFTRNIDYALFFALRDLPSTDSSVWVLPVKKYLKNTSAIVSDDDIDFIKRIENSFEVAKCIFNPDANINNNICILNPQSGNVDESLKLMNRINRQEGIFLFPSRFDKLFWEYLREIPRGAEKDDKAEEINQLNEIESNITENLILRIDIPNSVHYKLLENLLRQGINNMKFFPDEEGFMKDFKYFLNFQFPF